MKTIFSSAWLDAISCCGKDLQLKIIRAVVHYQETGQMPEQMTPSVRMALRLIIALSPTDAEMVAPESVSEDMQAEVETTDTENDNEMVAADEDVTISVADEEASATTCPSRPGLSPIGKVLRKARKSERKSATKKRLKK